MIRAACIALAILIAAPLLADDEKVTVGLRSHLVITDSGGRTLGRATRMSQWTEAWDRGTVVFESEHGDRLLLEDEADYDARILEWRIRDWKGDDFIAMRVPLPFSGTTQTEAFAEADATRMQIFTMSRDEIEIETKAGTWKGSEAAWNGEARAALTRDLRRSISFELLETIERVAESGFAIEAARGHRSMLEYLLYRPVCGAESIRVTESVPDCAFDARLGFPCSEKQRERAKKAADVDSDSLMH